ncbi:MAG TPA: bifunctional (p)ppGpp synthetase/guanosine-3',5'-bis(diphosphate) 3'-pyrophosphohydrolase, partial [Bacilli bacterium]|nr:bifunctional (p)ppGpp synthetase/guanosine-3',5'-bis(diphosphate) 3'-pyrophosphohydrolase [Bacilli bacterium]
IDGFGLDVANIVDGVTKISKLKYMTKEKALAKSHQKILLAMAKDIRVVLVKLLNRVNNMRTLEFQPHDKQIKIAKETMDLYAPLAHRLGMYRIKAELEDISFKYLDPEQYQNIFALINQQKTVREEDIRQMQVRLEELLSQNHIEKYDIKGRVKNIYSVYKKMTSKDLDFDQIYDLMALRIIVSTIESCYHVLGLVHGHWTPIPKRFKDYIATPKPNLYQSLHSTVVGLNGKIYEIQIRTYEMDEIAEFGIAAHWVYKENKVYSPQEQQLEIAAKLRWYKELLTYAEIGESEDSDPLETIREDIFSANVYVFTPKGDVLDFPTGATPLDFAYRIHTEVGNHTTGAIVNGKIVPLTYKLKTGDVVEIKTSKSFVGPNEAWLKIVKTSHAKHKITSVLNRLKRDALVSSGKEEFERILKQENIPQLKLDDKLVNAHFGKYGVNNLEDFYFEIGKNAISAKGAANRLAGRMEKLDEEALIKQYSDEEKKKKTRHPANDLGIYVEGLSKTQIKLANCCHPIFGDDIVGYVSKGYGIVVHRLECHNTRHSDEQRFIEVFWDPDFTRKSYETSITILSFDRRNIVAEMINALNSVAVTIKHISSGKNKDGDLLTKVRLDVPNLSTLKTAIANIKKISDVHSIERVIK